MLNLDLTLNSTHGGPVSCLSVSVLAHQATLYRGNKHASINELLYQMLFVHFALRKERLSL